VGSGAPTVGHRVAQRRGASASARRAGRVLVLAARRFWEQDMFHHAAALTYQSVLSLFPAMLLVVALLGLLGDGNTVDELRRFLNENGANAQLVDGLTAAARDAVAARASSVVALVLVVPFALHVSASAFVSASTALNVVLEAEDRRSFLRRRLHATAATTVVLLLAVAAIVAVFLGGGLAEALLGQVGLGATAATVWSVVRLPLGGLLMMTAFAWLYFAAPTVQQPRWRWITLGSAVAVAVWLLASIGLFLFARSGSMGTTYGTFATAILLLSWLWLTNVALLLGAEINAAGRFAEGTGAPMSETGHSPENAQHEAAKRDRPA
jgi:membrane protein